MRLFIAINLPPEIRQGMWEAAEPLRCESYPIRWLPPQSLHLTLKFLGEAPPEQEGEIVGAVEEAVRGTKRFVLPIGGFGVFPSVARPRVVWAGCEAVPALELLQHRVEQLMGRLGFPIEGRPFRPHVTLGRVRHGARPAALAGLGDALERLEYAAAAPVESLDLMQSELSPKGARYTVRHPTEFTA